MDDSVAVDIVDSFGRLAIPSFSFCWAQVGMVIVYVVLQVAVSCRTQKEADAVVLDPGISILICLVAGDITQIENSSSQSSDEASRTPKSFAQRRNSQPYR